MIDVKQIILIICGINSIIHVILCYDLCSSRKYPHSYTEGIGISWGWVALEDKKKLKKCMELIWNFQSEEKVIEKILSVGAVQIFS